MVHRPRFGRKGVKFQDFTHGTRGRCVPATVQRSQGYAFRRRIGRSRTGRPPGGASPFGTSGCVARRVSGGELRGRKRIQSRQGRHARLPRRVRRSGSSLLTRLRPLTGIFDGLPSVAPDGAPVSWWPIPPATDVAGYKSPRPVRDCCARLALTSCGRTHAGFSSFRAWGG